ncbi:4'-phosphopantetheinyl transferase [Paenibacillus sp. 4624]|uniref:4'-phosphopantetheinyl transferase superfamily protein n=2 Tax=Paenibacillus TaxID=44249 RepID=A0A5M9WR74_PAEAM|nr:4'-phosphopantetheinyl transferase superfamily protein [Paenibacillus amylolyticus]
MMITIQVLQVPSVIPEVCWDLFLSSVSEERRAQASRFIHLADTYRSVMGEVLARVKLSKLTGLGHGEITFTRNKYGKPALTHDADVQFNVSHSGDWVALITGSKDELGVDVEKIAPIDLQIAERFFSSSECQLLDGKPEVMKRETFYRLWTLKESYIKAVGMGLSMPLDSFAILPHVQQDGELDWRCNHDGQIVRHRFYSHPLDEQHMFAACAAEGELPNQPEIVTLESLYTELV